MAFGEHDFQCDQGSTFTQTVTYKTLNADNSTTAINLSGYYARMDVRFALTKEADFVIQLTQANGRALVTTPNSGVITLNIASTDTATLTPATYFYDLEVFQHDSTDANYTNSVKRILQGKFEVTPEVTG